MTRERAQTTQPILTEGAVLKTSRLRLAALPHGALSEMSWLQAALGPEWSIRDLEAAVQSGRGVLISDAQGTAIGVAAALPDTPALRCASVPFLAIDPDRRFRGLGGEAGLAVERHLRSLGFMRVYAPVPEDRGLAVYFWLRQGFRPLLAAESPGPLAGLDGRPMPGIWMLRE